MKNLILSLLFLSVLVFVFTSCKKKKGCLDPISVNYDSASEEDDGSCVYAGTGGSTTLVLKAKHHGMIIPNTFTYPDTAYVKFNAVTSPGTTASNYDAIFVGEAPEDHVHLEGLKIGKYFILMTGYDSTIGKRVIGGIPYTLTIGSGEVDLDIPVSED